MKDTFLGIPFYRFYFPGDIKGIEEACKTLNYRPNGSNMIWDGVIENGYGGSDLHRHPHPELINLFVWIDQCLDEVAKDMGMDNRLKINSAWSHLNRPGQFFYDHTHANCFVSSNYYVSGLEQDKTKWFLPNPYFDKTNIWPWGEWDEDKFFLTHEESTEPGKYVVFPPMIRHRAAPNSAAYDRITIAANAFPDGYINSSGVSHLDIKVL